LFLHDTANITKVSASRLTRRKAGFEMARLQPRHKSAAKTMAFSPEGRFSALTTFTTDY
jgi:hypothetical protein